MSLPISHGLEFPLWPGSAPGSEGLNLVELVEQRSVDPARVDRAVSRVSCPTLKVMLPAHPSGAAMLVAPGGGYIRLCIDHEGAAIGEWLNQQGIVAFILKSRLPCDGHAAPGDVPLQDAQRAMRLIRANADAWGLRPDRIGALGCSAGGHLVATLATCFERQVYAPVDAVDEAPARPDCVVLLYPVISMEAALAHEGSRQALLGVDVSPAREMAYSCERHVRTDTPPTFISHASDDESVVPEHSIRFYLALRKAGVSAELHVFETGGHGHGIWYASGPVRQWTAMCETWLRGRLLSA